MSRFRSSGSGLGRFTSALNSKVECPTCGRTVTVIGNANGAPGRWVRHNADKGIVCSQSGHTFEPGLAQGTLDGRFIDGYSPLHYDSQ